MSKKKKKQSKEEIKPAKAIVICCNQHFVVGKKIPVPMLPFEGTNKDGSKRKGYACKKCLRSHEDSGKDDFAIQTIIDAAMNKKDSPDVIPVYIDDFEQLQKEISL